MDHQVAPHGTLEQRLRAVEDKLAILNLVASHPLGADTGAASHVQAMWAPDGVIDLANGKEAAGHVAIAAMVAAPGHQAAIAGGLAHFAGLPHIELTGDTAVVTSYLQILTPQPDGAVEAVEVPNHGASRGFRVHRVGVNRWELQRDSRDGTGWKIKRRTLRPLDGSEPARALLRQALDGSTRPAAGSA